MKKNLLKKLLVIFGITLSSYAFVSCGPDQNNTDNTIKVYFWHTFGHDIITSINKKINSFQTLIKEREGVDVKIEFLYQGGYSDILSKVKNGLTSGNVPTITVAYPDHVADYLSNEINDGDYVVNLENLINDPDIGLTSEDYLNPTDKGISDFVTSFYDEGTHYIKEGLYSLPFMKSTEIMFYNKTSVNKLLTEYGVTTSQEAYLNSLTWDNFMNLLSFAKQDLSSYGTDLEVPLIYDSDENLFITQCYQRNLPYVSLNNGVGSMDFNCNNTKSMVSELKTKYDAGLFKTKGTNDNVYGSDSFTLGKCIFSIGSSGGASYNDPGAASFEVGVCRVPAYSLDNAKYVTQGPTLTMLNSNGISAEENALRIKYGWKFLKYILNPENNSDICLDSGGYVPVRSSAYLDGYYKEFLENEEDYLSMCCDCVHSQIGDNYLNYPVFKGTADARKEVGGIITNVLLEKKTLDVAFSDALNAARLAM